MRWCRLYILYFLALSVYAGDCDPVINFNFDNILVNEIKFVEENNGLPSFCKIKGVINPNIGFEARLPKENWNGKFFQVGCGGFCGLIEPDKNTQSNGINHALKKGYAAITTNGGHVGMHLGDAQWAKNNEQAREVYAYSVVKFTFEAGHKLIKNFYNLKPKFSYFSGCSNGGRLAAKAAQIYPNLFDGIISGCPVLSLTKNGGIFGPWLLQANLDNQDNEVLTDNFNEKLIWLEDYVLKKCDALDGTEDHVIQNAEVCNITFDDVAICNELNSTSCLSTEEKNVLLKLYAGPSNSAGEKLFYGINPGSERYLGYWYLGNKNMRRPGTLLADGFLPNFGFGFRDNFYAQDFNFDKDIKRLSLQSSLLDATNPNLKAFFESNGKLIMWAGLADPLVLPQQSVDYFNSVKHLYGEQTNDFFKLFLVPGMGHCWEIESRIPDQMSMLSALENWVEKNISPEFVPINNISKDAKIVDGLLRPYPLLAEY
jgi:hypothetical protein